jgi:hypothetical protein
MVYFCLYDHKRFQASMTHGAYLRHGAKTYVEVSPLPVAPAGPGVLATKTEVASRMFWYIWLRQLIIAW